MLRAVGYEPSSRTMKVVFRTGEVYEYEDVPQSEYDGLLEAKSIGKYMQSNIIDVYPYVKVRDIE
jgi:hypothetical protein